MTFGHLEIAYDDRVLEPRAWTVMQSRWAASLLGSAPDGPVLELCAGAGQIGLLAVVDSDRRLVCVDLNPAACELTLQNARAAGVLDRVEVRHGRISEVLEPRERFALVVADPPWVPSGGVGRFPDDPLLAIDGGDTGLDVARECVDAVVAHLLPGGAALLQLGTAEQAGEVGRWLDAVPDLALGEVRSHEDRGVVALLQRAG
jgi:methylase of polypeptide subunit release factors